MAWKIVTPPAAEPVTLTEAKNHLKVEHSADDALITTLISAARQFIERQTGLALVTQTIDEFFDEFPDAIDDGTEHIELTVWPVQSVTSIKYYDSAGTLTTFASTNYRLDDASRPARIALEPDADWPDTFEVPGAVVVRYEAGFGDASAVPELLKAAVLLLVADLYENREDSPRTMPTHVDRLLNTYLDLQFA